MLPEMTSSAQHNIFSQKAISYANPHLQSLEKVVHINISSLLGTAIVGSTAPTDLWQKPPSRQIDS